MISREKFRIPSSSPLVRFGGSARSTGFGGRLNVMRRVDIVCAESSVSIEPTGTPGGIDSLAEGCVKGTCVVSCSCTDISSSALTGRLGGTKSGPRRDVASCCCGQKELPLRWISCASWVPTSDFLFPSTVRSICLCREIKKRAVWQTSNKVLETDGFCVCDTAHSFLGLGK